MAAEPAGEGHGDDEPAAGATPGDSGDERRLDPAWVTLSRISGWVKVAVLAVPWAIGAAVAALLGVPASRFAVLFGGLALLLVALAVRAQLWPRLAYRHTAYRLSSRGIEIRRGVLWRSVVNVPRSRVQHTDVSQGPLERGFGLATLIIHTAGTEHSRVTLPGLAHADASAVRDRLAAVDGDDAV